MQYIPGAVPAVFAGQTKFTPENSLDFGRRAKNLAKLLEIPLQETQECLAKAYGYADLHELQQALKKELSPGPYGDRLYSHFQTSDDVSITQLRLYWDSRLIKLLKGCVRRINTPIEFYDSLRLVCDLGLFLSPAAHRRATKETMAFHATGQDYSSEGYPFGYRSLMIMSFEWGLPLRENATDSLAEAVSISYRNARYHPECQVAAIQAWRAPYLFLRQAGRLMGNELSGYEVSELFFESEELDRTMLLYQERCGAVASEITVSYEQKFGREPSHDERVCGAFPFLGGR